MTTRRRVAVVTGGGGGIGGAIAEELGRGGWFVVTVDPLVTLDGSEQLSAAGDTTAGRIVAAGGAAQASAASVTDRDAIHALFRELADQHGGLDAVVNVAGITRQSYFAQGSEEDWQALLSVHLGGYLNVLDAALPLMDAAGHGRILGVTSGSGWRAADAGGYSAAKRAVAALTWQLGATAPPGVTVNAISPIANTRMVAAALERARQAGKAGGGGGLSLNSMPGPEDLGPLGAHLVGDDFGWCSGQVLFAAGSEVAVVDQPRLLEVVRTDGVTSLSHVLQSVIPRAFAAAESAQTTSGGSNPRFGPIFAEAGSPASPPENVKTCAVVSDRPGITAALTAALEARSVMCHRAEVGRDFGGAAAALGRVVEAAGPVDAIVVALAGRGAVTTAEPWQMVLADHQGLIGELHTDAAWARAAADYSASVWPGRAAGHAHRRHHPLGSQPGSVLGPTGTGRPVGVGHARHSLRGEPGDSRSGRGGPVAELVTHLLTHPEAHALAGAELAVGHGWIGLRRHPRATGTVAYGGPAVPAWLDATLREMVVTGPSESLPERAR